MFDDGLGVGNLLHSLLVQHTINLFMQKVYCHVDESGQDTEGKLFIVSVVITDTNKDESQKQLEKIEVGRCCGRICPRCNL